MTASISMIGIGTFMLYFSETWHNWTIIAPNLVMVEFGIVSSGELSSYFVHRLVDRYDHFVILSMGAGVKLGNTHCCFVIALHVIFVLCAIFSFVYVAVDWISVAKKG